MAQKYPNLARRLELEKTKATMDPLTYLEESKKNPQEMIVRVARLREKPAQWDAKTDSKYE